MHEREAILPPIWQMFNFSFCINGSMMKKFANCLGGIVDVGLRAEKPRFGFGRVAAEKSAQIHNPIRLKSMQHIQQPESRDQFRYRLYNIILVREVAKRYGGEASQRARAVSSASSWEFNYRLVASPGTGGASTTLCSLHPRQRQSPKNGSHRRWSTKSPTLSSMIDIENHNWNWNGAVRKYAETTRERDPNVC
ncbi:hypothetical protein TcasGA2_TC004614 [Tribolium castaneum]|uniref:Uncharacterized protein n=1 Tax=Tribolium castaneum TaxID=7070 RepID=D6W7Y7_TRICA|nr:hypothetical protein TcasGA2_TC004614 [Tribolium castaneum]